MRKKLINLLRHLEEGRESYFENIYHDELGYEHYDYEITEIVHYPNFRTIINRYNDKFPLSKHNNQQPITLDSPIRSEIKRLELDGIIYIGNQKGMKYAHTDNKYGPDYDDGNSFDVESIMLTTKGKSMFGHIKYKIEENIVSISFSLLALIISIISIFI